ncbi:hypothetical protein NKR23_g6854 [Pleurostoma richardsiae]|uniref:DNA mismatch repair protein HSM3 N-terminal domain-containing protein n=1 Tax=Pleurostoma richardsiae TaxID=41990 RepID=A0AA38RNC6_9PEZI|nr:hypothetical protein NKR23_g6854 [Pleurostoma richardsiae]
MDTVPITGVDELDQHLDELTQDPTLPLNAKLFDDVELQLTESNIPALIPRLLPKLTTLLKQYPSDPAALASLSTKLLGPLSFTQVLSLASADSLIQALRSPAPSANLLAMSVLHKAARSHDDAATLSTMPDLLAEFLRRWLAAPQVEVGERGGRVLGDLLDIDCELPPPPPPPRDTNDPLLQQRQQQLILRTAPGQGKMWRRLLHDKDIFHLIVALCSARDAETAASPRQLSLAQGRLLRVLPRLAVLNLAPLASSELTPSNEGMLHFAALHMVDTSDALMHLSLVDFFEALVSVTRVAEPRTPYLTETLRALLRSATEDDAELREALASLPDRTVPEEADLLRAWLREVMPASPTRVNGHWEGRNGS